MELNNLDCLYSSELKKNVVDFFLKGEEISHLKAFRYRSGDLFLATNLEGVSAISRVELIEKNLAKCAALEFFDDLYESNDYTALALGILENRDRFEFALEKAVELGIKEFYPIICDHSQKKIINIERLQAKAQAAALQSKRSRIPIISEAIKIEKLINEAVKFDLSILCDYDGKRFSEIDYKKTKIFFIGPEGGFSNQEISLLQAQSNYESIRLANRRLRAETAAIAALSCFAS